MANVMDVITECNDLIEAYLGYYEDEIANVTDKTEWAQRKILADSPKQRLETYCTWNGIIGYAGRMYEIATKGIIAL